MIFSPTAKDRKLMGGEGGRVILTRVWLCTFPWVSRKNGVHFLFRHYNLSKDIALETKSSICTYSKVQDWSTAFMTLLRISCLMSHKSLASSGCKLGPSPQSEFFGNNKRVQLHGQLQKTLQVLLINQFSLMEFSASNRAFFFWMFFHFCNWLTCMFLVQSPPFDKWIQMPCYDRRWSLGYESWNIWHV